MIEFIISTYNRTKQLMSMLSSLVAQIDNNWIATVVVDDVENDIARSVISKLDTDKIKLIFTGKRYNDWGHTPHNIGKGLTTADYIVMTNDDNYYVPSFVGELRNATNSSPGMVYWDMITNNWDNYRWFNSRIVDGYIDMGAFATRNDIAKQIDINPALFAADHFFVMEFNKRFPNEKVIKIEKILFVHN